MRREMCPTERAKHSIIKLCLVRVLQDWAAAREGKFSCFRMLSDMEKNGFLPTSNGGKTRVLNETTPLKLDSQLLDNGAYEGGDLNRKCVLTLSIVSVVFNIVVGGTGFVFAFQRNSASIYAFAAECLLDMLSSMIVIWQYLTPHYSFARERIACMLLGLFFILSAIAIITKAMDDLIVRESPTWIPVLIILAGVGAAACFLLALIKLILAKRLGSLSLVLDGINSLISSFCAVAIIVSDLVYDSNPEIWYMDAVLSTVAAVIMLLVGAKVLFENWSLGRHGHITLH